MWYIRRITMAKLDPVAMACIDCGYSVVPSQSDKDKDGNLLNNPFDPECTEWLVEMPIQVPWANKVSEEYDLDKISAIAQLDFYMNAQLHYVRHNGSFTLNYREDEIDAVTETLYGWIEDGLPYISIAMLPRFEVDASIFPRLPFEPISKEEYEKLSAQNIKTGNGKSFFENLQRYDQTFDSDYSGPLACSGMKCEVK
jgi:ribonucleotide reductase class II